MQCHCTTLCHRDTSLIHVPIYNSIKGLLNVILLSNLQELSVFMYRNTLLLFVCTSRFALQIYLLSLLGKNISWGFSFIVAVKYFWHRFQLSLFARFCADVINYNNALPLHWKNDDMAHSGAYALETSKWPGQTAPVKTKRPITFLPEGRSIVDSCHDIFASPPLDKIKRDTYLAILVSFHIIITMNFDD